MRYLTILLIFFSAFAYGQNTGIQWNRDNSDTTKIWMNNSDPVGKTTLELSRGKTAGDTAFTITVENDSVLFRSDLPMNITVGGAGGADSLYNISTGVWLLNGDTIFAQDSIYDANTSTWLKLGDTIQVISAASFMDTVRGATTILTQDTTILPFATTDFVFGSDSLGDSGADGDNRFIFDKSKAFFGAGQVLGNDWDESRRGFFSASLGQANEVSGNASFAAGSGHTVTGTWSGTIGSTNVVSNSYAFSAGRSNNSSGEYNIALGSSNVTSSPYSVAIGALNAPTGTNSVAIGLDNIPKSYAEVSVGLHPTEYTAASSSSFNSADRLFVVGNGDNSGVDSVSDAMTILKSGVVGIGIDSLEDNKLQDQLLQVAGTTYTQGLQVGDTAATGYIFPSATGSANDVLSVNASGDLVFGAPAVTGYWDTIILSTNTDTILVQDSTKLPFINSDFVFGAPDRSYSANTDHTNKMIFDKSQGSFMAGIMDTTFWDWNFISAGTANFGENNRSTSAHSIVAGKDNINSSVGNYVVMFGFSNTVSNNRSSITGGQRNTITTAGGFIGGGEDNTVSGIDAVVVGGDGNTASANDAAVLGGGGNTASSVGSAVIGGQLNTASGQYSLAGQAANTAYSFAEAALGAYSTTYTPDNATAWDVNDRLFNIGRGTGAGNRRDAFTIMKSGMVGIGKNNFEADTLDGQLLQVAGTTYTQGLQVNDTAATGYIFPAATGTEGQALRVNASGDLAFSSAFSAEEFNISTVTTNDTMTTTTGITVYNYIYTNNSGDTVEVFLPDTATFDVVYHVYCDHDGADEIRVNTIGPETIGGNATFVLNPGSTLSAIRRNGTLDWFIR